MIYCYCFIVYNFLIMINLLNYNLFEDLDKRHWIYTLREIETNRSDDIENLLNIHFIELRKFKKKKK